LHGIHPSSAAAFSAAGILGQERILRFDLAARQLSRVIELPFGGIEGISQCHVHILVMHMVDDDFLAWHTHVQIDLEVATLLVMLAQLLDPDSATGDIRMEYLELCDLLANSCLEGFGLRKIPDSDLKWNLH
jgi:hypothetical protein